MYEFEQDTEDEEELEPRVKYSVILQKEDYLEDEEEDPAPYEVNPGYYFFLNQY
jgi:hypothetical protein